MPVDLGNLNDPTRQKYEKFERAANNLFSELVKEGFGILEITEFLQKLPNFWGIKINQWMETKRADEIIK